MNQNYIDDYRAQLHVKDVYINQLQAEVAELKRENENKHRVDGLLFKAIDEVARLTKLLEDARYAWNCIKIRQCWTCEMKAVVMSNDPENLPSVRAGWLNIVRLNESLKEPPAAPNARIKELESISVQCDNCNQCWSITNPGNTAFSTRGDECVYWTCPDCGTHTVSCIYKWSVEPEDWTIYELVHDGKLSKPVKTGMIVKPEQAAPNTPGPNLVVGDDGNVYELGISDGKAAAGTKVPAGKAFWKTMESDLIRGLDKPEQAAPNAPNPVNSRGPSSTWPGDRIPVPPGAEGDGKAAAGDDICECGHARSMHNSFLSESTRCQHVKCEGKCLAFKTKGASSRMAPFIPSCYHHDLCPPKSKGKSNTVHTDSNQDFTACHALDELEQQLADQEIACKKCVDIQIEKQGDLRKQLAAANARIASLNEQIDANRKAFAEQCDAWHCQAEETCAGCGNHSRMMNLKNGNPGIASACWNVSTRCLVSRRRRATEMACRFNVESQRIAELEQRLAEARDELHQKTMIVLERDNARHELTIVKEKLAVANARITEFEKGLMSYGDMLIAKARAEKYSREIEEKLRRVRDCFSDDEFEEWEPKDRVRALHKIFELVREGD